MNPIFTKIVLVSAFSFSLLSTNAQRLDSITSFIQRVEYQKALDQIKGIKDADSDVTLMQLKATVLKRLNRYQEAIPIYEQLHKKDTTDLKTAVELADCYQSINDYTNEQAIYQKMISFNKQNLFLIQQLANSYYLENDFKHAINHYRNAYQSDSSYYLTKQLAMSYDNLNRTDSAIHYYKRVLALNPMEFHSTSRMAAIYKQLKEYKTSIALTETFLKTDSLNLKMLRTNGYMYFLDEDYEPAIQRFEKCRSLNDTAEFTVKHLGFSYFKHHDYDQARELLDQAFKEDTTNVEVCYALGLSCIYSNYERKGVIYLEKSIDLLTPSPTLLSQIYRDLAATKAKLVRNDEALAAYLKAYELNPNDLLTYDIANFYYERLNNKKEALKYYRLFMSMRPKDNKTLFGTPVPEEIVLSYYEFVEKRMADIEKTIIK